MTNEARDRIRRDRPWREYLKGTKAYSTQGGYWIKVDNGWKWHNGSVFPAPGAEACGKCIELPSPTCKSCDQLKARLAELEACLLFVRDECDWEESANEYGGDNRIGPAITKAIDQTKE